MATMLTPACSVETCQNKKTKRLRVISTKKGSWFICEQCVKWFLKVGQLVID